MTGNAVHGRSLWQFPNASSLSSTLSRTTCDMPLTQGLLKMSWTTTIPFSVQTVNFHVFFLLSSAWGSWGLFTMTFSDLLLIQVSSFYKHLHLKGRHNTKKVESFQPNTNKRGLVNFATRYNCCHCQISNMLWEIEMGDSNCWGHVKSLE